MPGKLHAGSQSVSKYRMAAIGEANNKPVGHENKESFSPSFVFSKSAPYLHKALPGYAHDWRDGVKGGVFVWPTRNRWRWDGPLLRLSGKGSSAVVGRFRFMDVLSSEHDIQGQLRRLPCSAPSCSAARGWARRIQVWSPRPFWDPSSVALDGPAFPRANKRRNLTHGRAVRTGQRQQLHGKKMRDGNLQYNCSGVPTLYISQTLIRFLLGSPTLVRNPAPGINCPRAPSLRHYPCHFDLKLSYIPPLGRSLPRFLARPGFPSHLIRGPGPFHSFSAP